MFFNQKNFRRFKNTESDNGLKYLNKLSNYKITMQALFLFSRIFT